MQLEIDRIAEHLIKLGRELRLPIEAYRFILPEYPLPAHGPSRNDCASAGSYITGRRTNAKGLHGILYTALHPKVAAVEIMDPPTGLPPNKTATLALEEAKRGRYQLFKITVRLKRVLDLTRLPTEELRPFVHPYSAQHASCRLLPKMTLAQRVGWKALLKGYDGIVRPSAAFWRRWGEGAARAAPVLDIICPNTKLPLSWELIKPTNETYEKSPPA